MSLDFHTLYIILLLNSLSLALAWALIAFSYRFIVAARYWLAALVMSCASGPLLFLDGSDGLLTYAGLTLVSGCFAMMWQGIRVFYGKAALPHAVLAIMIGTACSLMAFGSSREAINVIAAISQIIPVALAINVLLTAAQRSGGAYVALLSAGIVIIGQGAEALTNTLRLLGYLDSAGYYSVAAWFLVCAIIGGSVWNLSFLLMTVDRLWSELRTLATRDDLTGVLNRRGMNEKLASCEKAVKRRQSSASLLMVDLDRFKTINDRFGHAAGDAALVHIADIARTVLRDGDVLGRIGGDEFCILLPHTNSADASAIAASLDSAIIGAPLDWKGEKIGLSASIGLTEWKPDSAFGLAESLPLADASLLDNKRTGRNKLALAS